MASRSPTVARVSNLIAGLVLIALCVPFGLLAGLARKYFGPDSPVSSSHLQLRRAAKTRPRRLGADVACKACLGVGRN
jgi:hypothetical protein